MSIFDFHASVVDDYQNYIRSFLAISDDQVRRFVDAELLENNKLWPDPLLQLSPAFRMASTVDELATAGVITKATAEIFRRPDGAPLQLYQHQEDAIRMAARRQSYVVTSGTGSGKTLTYFIPIFDTVLREHPEQPRVRAIVIYPMNALVNSQQEALTRFADQYSRSFSRPMPVRFAKYTGQESEEEKQSIQQEPPHILLTNFMMLEMMLLRPQESHFVDRGHAELEFLVLDELHMYRGRQGADVAMLIRRLKQRSGRIGLIHVGTSATMVADPAASQAERRQAVAEFASRLFGAEIPDSNVVEETLVPMTSLDPVTPAELSAAIHAPTPSGAEELLTSPLARWIESVAGLEQDGSGTLRRRSPRNLSEVARELAKASGESKEVCSAKLREFLLAGSRVKRADGGTLFPIKLHQFISQGRSLYATLEPRGRRETTLEGRYYASPSPEGSRRLLFPVTFCRVCGQDYYKVLFDQSQQQILPWEATAEDPEAQGTQGYLMLPPEDTFVWSDELLPPEWLTPTGRVIKKYRQRVPRQIYVRPDGSVADEPDKDTVRAFFQMAPFLICQSCGEYYTQREGDFRKLTGLSSEGRSSATTILAISALHNAPTARIPASTRKLLSFTDNRQDASLQAGHFNDFVQVSLLRAAIYKALQDHEQLCHHNIADRAVEALRIDLKDIAAEPALDPDSPKADQVRQDFRDLIEYRIYEDLRRAWRVVHPNLEQCGLLRISYRGLEQACERDELWRELPVFHFLPAAERFEILKPILDFARRKLAIRARCLEETYQQQLIKRVNQVLNDRWKFDESEQRLRSADRFVMPGQKGTLPGVRLGPTSLIGRYLRRRLPEIADYDTFLGKLVEVLVGQGLFCSGQQRGVRFIQLDAAVIIWCKGEGTPPPPDPIYARRLASPAFREVQRQANEFFTELYRNRARSLRDVEGQAHTAQVQYDDRIDREHRFRQGNLKALFCSPTMELGIDISDLQLVHLRGVPPSPARYAQRSGRAGRSGEPAVVFTYCSANSGHDQYFFRLRQQMVAGVVQPPRIDISNEDMVKAHIQALWFSKINLRIDHSVSELLVLDDATYKYPLKDEIQGQIRLSEARIAECIAEGNRILEMCGPEVRDADWYRPDWVEAVVRNAPEQFDRAFDRWRQLFQAATKQLGEAQKTQATTLDDKVQREAQQQVTEALRQRNLLLNMGTTRQESDFYPHRYLSAEGFLPGYNFPRLPIRAYVPRKDGEFLSRARFLALTEYGPENFIYHEGVKYQVKRFFVPPGGLASRRTSAKLCNICGYWNSDSDDRCGNCRSSLDASTSLFVHSLDMPNVRTIRRDRITCDEEERRRRGYETTLHYRFAPGGGGRPSILESSAGADPEQPLLRILFAPSAELYKVNHGWRASPDKGYAVDLITGEINPAMENTPEENVARVRLYTRTSDNLLLVYPPPAIQQNGRAMASLQYALQRGMEQLFQVEESELASERIGDGQHRAILFWEAAEGGVGILRRIVEEETLVARLATAALERLHFDPATGEDRNPDCSQACYECLLSYRNQPDHRSLDRHAVVDVLRTLTGARTFRRHAKRDYEQHYQYLRKLTDSRSELERRFLEHLYTTRRKLPDEAQKALVELPTVPDFYFASSHACVFCDGSVHDSPEQMARDNELRQQLRELGYRVIVIRYDKDLEDQIRTYPEVFGEGKR